MSNITPLFAKCKPVGSQKNWGMFGYMGYCLDLAIELDDGEAMKEAFRRGWIDTDSDTTFSTPLRTHCIRKGKVNAAKALEELGFPL